MCVIICQKYVLYVGLSQHASALSSLIAADWPSHYIVQNFKPFFSHPEISINVRHIPPVMDAPGLNSASYKPIINNKI